MSSLTLTPASFDRERHLPLLLEADDVEEHIHGYLDRGQLFEIHETDALIGVAVLVTDADAVEIWNIALSVEHRGRGSGRRAIGLIAERCREQGASRLNRRHLRLQPRNDRLLPQSRIPVRRDAQGLFRRLPRGGRREWHPRA